MTNSAILMQSTAAPASGASAMLIGILPWLLIFIIFYMLMIRPQQKRMKEHQTQLAAVKKALPGITGDGEVELSDLLKYVRSRTNGTDVYSSGGNPVARRLTTETRFRSQARAIVESIKSRTDTAPVGEPHIAALNSDGPQSFAPADTEEPKS